MVVSRTINRAGPGSPRARPADRRAPGWACRERTGSVRRRAPSARRPPGTPDRRPLGSAPRQIRPGSWLPRPNAHTGLRRGGSGTGDPTCAYSSTNLHISGESLPGWSVCLASAIGGLSQAGGLSRLQRTMSVRSIEGTGVGEAYEELRPLMFSIAYRMVGSVTDAEDIVQEAILRFHRESVEGTVIESPKAYLSAITTRLSIDHLR